MKTTKRFMLFDVLLIALALATAAGTFLTEMYVEAEKAALSDQDQRLKTFWRLLASKGRDIRSVDGRLLAGEYVLNGNYELPDALHEIFGCTATVFMGDTRVSTNVRTADGSRAVGTRLQGPAYDAVIRKGKPYRGEALILGIPYLTAYDPIRNSRGEIIGALYVGVKKSDYFSTYENFKIKVFATTAAMILFFSFLAFFLVRFQRKAQWEIQESNERFRVAFETIPDYISISTIQEGIWIDVNPGFTRMTGYARDEILGKSALTVNLWHDPDDRRRLLDLLGENGSVNDLESRFVHKDGHILLVSMSARIIQLGGTPYLFGFVKDITERRKAADALHRLNHVLRMLTRCNEVLVRARDETVLLRDICRIIVEDGTFCFAWVGYAENDAEKTVRPMARAGREDGYLDKLGLTWADTEKGRGPAGTAIRTGLPCLLKDTRDDPGFAPWREQALQRGYRSILSVPLVYATKTLGVLNVYASEPDGFDDEETELMVQLANDLAYGIVAIHTREKHRRTAEALYESAKENQKLAAAHDRKQRLLSALLDSIPDLIFYKDPTGVYLGCNKAFEAFAGKRAEELAGLTDLDIFPREVAEFFREMDQQMMSQRRSRRNEEWVDYPDGRRILLDTLKTPFYDHDGGILGLIGISRDITQQKNRDEERERLEAQLHQAQKMEAVGQLAGGIAHDFNNILTAIIGYSEIINLRLEKDNPLHHQVNQVMIAAERAAELTNGLLAFSRKQVLHTKPLDLCEVVQGLKKMLRRLIPEDIDFRTTVDDSPLIVMADKGQIEQVLMNLVTNAKDAMPTGGTLTIEVFPVDRKERFTHAHGKGEPGRYACISVADTGHGMDGEIREKIFEPFFTTKEVGKGTGLGMSIIYGIVNQHNGFITVESETGAGTTFHVQLPIIVQESTERHELPADDPPAGGTETILLAEDDLTVRELHGMMLEQAGYTIIAAVDGRDALDKFLGNPEGVDLLVTDVIMPNLDGKRLYDEIRKMRPNMKALFMSGYTKDLFVARGILEDEFSFMAKPISSTELLKKIRSILDRE